MGKEGVAPHTSKKNPQRHVNVGKGKTKEHPVVKSNVGATAIYGARKAAQKKK